jgi:uncharacterized protein YgiM (DUF1202 family)
MKKSFNSYIFIFFVLLLTGFACNFPQAIAQPAPPVIKPVNPGNPPGQVQPPPLIAFTETPKPTSTSTNTLQPTPQKPLVLKTTLCWVGPGTKYEVVSGLKQGENVEVIGRGSIEGWLIIRNPTYHDPCWVQASDLQIDASFDINALQVYNPPSLPTKTPKPTPIPSPIPSATLSP